MYWINLKDNNSKVICNYESNIVPVIGDIVTTINKEFYLVEKRILNSDSWHINEVVLIGSLYTEKT